MTTTTPITKTFKPGVARSAVTWTVHGDALLKNGQQVADLSRVTGGNFQYLRHRGTVNRTLKIKSAGGTKSIICGSVGENSSQRDMKEISAHALLRIAERSPDARFHIAGGIAVVIMMFVLGLAIFALGLFCLYIGFERSHIVPFFIGFVALGGGMWMAWKMRPWGNDRFKVPADLAMLAVLQSGAN